MLCARDLANFSTKECGVFWFEVKWAVWHGFVCLVLGIGNGVAGLGQGVAGMAVSGRPRGSVREVSGLVQRLPKSWWQVAVAVRVVRAEGPPGRK